MAQDSTYNIALDCIDKHAASLVNKHHTALIYVREESPGKLKEPALKLDFSSLKGLSDCFADALSRLKIQAGERMILMLPNSVEFPLSFLGAIKAGIIPVPVSAQLTGKELSFLLADSEAKVLVIAEEQLNEEILRSRPSSLEHLVVVTRNSQSAPTGTLRWQNLMKEARASFEVVPTAADAPAFWLYTSGTMGQPKAVIHAHRSIPAHDRRAQLWQDVKAGDIVFNTSSLNWSYALSCGLLDIWRHGLGSVVYQGSLQPELICRIVKSQGVTTLMSVPGVYRRLCDYAEQHPLSLPGLRVALSAGEKLPEEIRSRFHESTGLTIREGLGMTEHSVYLTQALEVPIVAGSCGQAIEPEKIKILRDDLSEASDGEVGILASERSCAGLMLGYHNRPEEEALVYRDRWFVSGDLASRDVEGNFFFAGRNDDVINAGGYRISPLEIEMVLSAHSTVVESAVVGMELEAGKTIVVAYVVLREGAPPPNQIQEELLEWARSRLALYKIPRKIYFIDELPKTPNGKLQRRKLLP